jgi:hypothetical protein
MPMADFLYATTILLRSILVEKNAFFMDGDYGKNEGPAQTRTAVAGIRTLRDDHLHYRAACLYY